MPQKKTIQGYIVWPGIETGTYAPEETYEARKALALGDSWAPEESYAVLKRGQAVTLKLLRNGKASNGGRVLPLARSEREVNDLVRSGCYDFYMTDILPLPDIDSVAKKVRDFEAWVDRNCETLRQEWRQECREELGLRSRLRSDKRYL